MEGIARNEDTGQVPSQGLKIWVPCSGLRVQTTETVTSSQLYIAQFGKQGL